MMLKNFLHICGFIVTIPSVIVLSSLPWDKTANLAEAKPTYYRLRTTDVEFPRAYQLLVSRLSNKHRVNLVNSQLAWMRFRYRECEFANSFNLTYRRYTKNPQCLYSLTSRRNNELNYYLRGRIPPMEANNYNDELRADNQLKFQYQLLKLNRNPEQATKLEAAESAWIDFRNKTCEFEITLWRRTAKDCRQRLTEQRIREITSYL